MYYMEEQVKMLSEIISQAEPILNELASQVYQFQKLATKKQSSRQRDTELFERYGKEDFMAERDKLNISFHHLKEVEQIQQQKQYKISVRNNLGIKQNDDWIFNLNIGNVMHLSLMSSDELPGLHNINKEVNSNVQASMDTLKSKAKIQFETSHELCKDAMLEKIVLISASYFCIATEMRYIIQKQPNKSSTGVMKKDSEMYHAKALHISSLFLPRECPLVQHVQQSYVRNYLKDKKPFQLREFLAEIGINLESSYDGTEESHGDIDEGLVTQSQQVKSTHTEGGAGVKKSKKVSQNVPRRHVKPSSKIQGIPGLRAPHGQLTLKINSSGGIQVHKKQTVPHARIGIDPESNIVKLREGLSK